MRSEFLRVGGRIVEPFGLALPQGYNMYQQLPTDVQAEIAGWLGPQVAGGASQAAAYAQQFSDIGQQAFGVLQDLSGKNYGKAIGDATPLIAVGLAVLGASPVVGVAVLAGVSLVGALANALFPPPAPQQCSYALGYTCFHMGARAAGPKDPQWVTIEQFNSTATSAGNISWETLSGYNFLGNWGSQAFPWWNLVGMELYALGDRSTAATDWAAVAGSGKGFYSGYANADDAANKMYLKPNAYRLALLGDAGKSFLIAFDHAFIKMQEVAINGFSPLPTNILLGAVVDAWNTGYSTDRQYQFDPNTDIANVGAQDTSSATFIEWVLGGGYDQQRWPIPPINLGLKLSSLKFPTSGFSNSTPGKPPGVSAAGTSTGSKVVTTAVVVGAASAGGLYWYASQHGITMMQALSRLRPW